MQTESDLTRRLSRPLTIGRTEITNRLVLAPMTFLGHIAFRELLAGYGGYGLLFSEMCSARRIPNELSSGSAYFCWRESERGHLVVQIFGAEPKAMATAARIIQDSGLFGVDLNFGCSVATICKQQSGAALLKTPDQAMRIVEAVRRAVTIPLFVKFRTGWEDDPAIPVDLARRFESAGADALTFHPRVAPDRRSRPPRWDYIRQVKAAVSIPVFGNGDVFDEADCLRMLQTTACDGVAIGRMAIARPWLMAGMNGRIPPDGNIYRETAMTLLNLMQHHFDPRRVLRRYKKFALYYSANFKFAHSFYTRINNAPDLESLKNELERFFSHRPETVTRPNMNFFL
ncbi:tRNA dihydrouridine synthase [Desulfosarcina ovata]|uniref:tRNA-dihydrouridine synthase n=1 Tax=Desulfosarcina ovata subsp. ovata TaxID=2752305 RepID=A0A5K8AEN6_9BACT|nr:tRNA-dihydrouridine synthase family protein [Desulfosarcina ovata]BBO91105.1 tRNA-dihydrouridine synthase [Desulfosarcina ovata subsp. ovata]